MGQSVNRRRKRGSISLLSAKSLDHGELNCLDECHYQSTNHT